MSLRIEFVVPPGTDLNNGNRRTARRWAHIVQSLGHSAVVQAGGTRRPADLLVALHAHKSLAAMRRFHADFPDRPIVVALTGTDLYGTRSLVPALEMAAAILVLQGHALEQIPKRFRARTQVIYQSAVPPARRPAKPVDRFEITVVGHLRSVKDPFRAAMAVRKLPTGSQISVLQIGRALTPSMEERAERENERNDRYRWIGEVAPAKARRLLAASHLTVISSKVEGSSNVLSEALVSGVPVVASRIPGLIGTLGNRYPGLYPYGDTAALRALLLRAEGDRPFLERLQKEGEALIPLVLPERETLAWADLLRSVC